MNRTCIKNVLTGSLATVSLLASFATWSDVAVIINPANNNTLSGADVTRIFLGKKKSFPDGSDVIPIDQSERSETRTTFIKIALKKNNQQIKAYWAQLLFTGKGTPPRQVESAADVKKLVAQNPSLIGYIDSSEVDDTVKVAYEY